MKREFGLEIGGSHVLLLADKALYWPERKLMCVADAHFGKAAAYRALGQPVPHGTTAANLARLDALLTAYPTEQLIFLGDFLHAKKSHAPATLAALQRWRQRHPALSCVLIRGNHDRHAGDPPAALEMSVVNEPLLVGPFALRHSPAPHDTLHVIAGHTHPVFRLRGSGRQRMRLPCFFNTQAMTVLPSFGDFTGGCDIERRDGHRIFVTDGAGIWALQSPPLQERVQPR